MMKNIIFFLILLAQIASSENLNSQKHLEFFESNIRPLLAKHCYKCHSEEEKMKGNLLLDSKLGWQVGGDSGPSIIPGKPEKSLLIESVLYENTDLQMPPKYKLEPHEIDTLKQWISIGAPDPRTTTRKIQKATEKIDLEQGRKFWAFQEIKQPTVPKVLDTTWPKGNIDLYLLKAMVEQGLTPAPDTKKVTLIRRAYFDLIGLPPTPKQIEMFISNHHEDAYELMIDQLLARIEFGERWGRHWLDVTRFAESSGGGRSFMYKDAWRFRDYIIQSFNQDKPFNQLLTEHIAGDLLNATTNRERNEQVIGAGYLMLGPINYEQQDKVLLQMDVIDEQINTIGKTFMGMTLSCARCHDHPFDPIGMKDYYGLAGIFKSTQTLKGSKTEGVSSFMTQNLLPIEHSTSNSGHLLAIAETSIENSTIGEATKPIPENKKNNAPTAMSVRDAEDITDSYIHIRGEARNHGPIVSRGFIRVAMDKSMTYPPEINQDSSGRLEMAQWMSSPKHPLTARVFVNRVWNYLFSEGIVRTLDNFGKMGERPSHPALLDYLAWTFINEGWSTKKLIKKIMMSRAYQMSSHLKYASNSDPDNRYLSYFRKKRLEAEAIRDAMLVISDELDDKRYGLTIRKLKTFDLGYQFNSKRRSVYVPSLRNSVLDLFQTFDQANANLVTGKRNVSTVPTQSLYMMNSPFTIELSTQTAQKIIDLELTGSEKIVYTYQLILGRKPHHTEFELTQSYLNSFDKDSEAFSSLCQSLFASMDFRYVY